MDLLHAMVIVHSEIGSNNSISLSFNPIFSNLSANIKDCSTNISKKPRNIFVLKLGADIFRFLVHMDAKINITKELYKEEIKSIYIFLP